jgi:hypothetical protein
MSSTRTAAVDQLELEQILEHASAYVTTEYASLTRAGAPITWPVTPYRRDDRSTIDVSTGLTYPLKAERARRDPRVALSFSFPAGSGLADPATVLVQGLATVRDADLRETSSSYLRSSMERFPDSFASIPRFQLARMDWYWTRMWVEVTPVRVWWWDHGDLRLAPRTWSAPSDITAPPSDPAPPGRGPGAWRRAPAPAWQRRTAGVLDRLGLPVLTTVDDAGWPLPVRALAAEATEEGFRVELPEGVRVAAGPAFVSFHSHGEVFDGQENVGLSARVQPASTAGARVVDVQVERALSDWGISSNPLRSAFGMWRAGRGLRPRLRAEAARRGVRLPTFDELDLG